MRYIPTMTPGERATRSILAEATAIKAGNVHPLAPFTDMSHTHFVAAAHAIGQAIDAHAESGIGQTVWSCTRAMLDAVAVNTSLGTILLLVPLAKLESVSNSDGVEAIDGSTIQKLLDGTTRIDCQWIYESIRMVHPGGLGRSDQSDINGPAPSSIVQAMQIAASRDDVALQYTNGFREVLAISCELQSKHDLGMDEGHAIRALQIELLAQRPDSLIVRKHGADAGLEVQRRAARVLEAGAYGSPPFEHAWSEFDEFLRASNQRRNPGTSADLIAAALYAQSLAWT
jgi:triphosphoribosyl-dephospho-CoA synthase